MLRSCCCFLKIGFQLQHEWRNFHHVILVITAMADDDCLISWKYASSQQAHRAAPPIAWATQWLVGRATPNVHWGSELLGLVCGRQRAKLRVQTAQLDAFVVNKKSNACLAMHLFVSALLQPPTRQANIGCALLQPFAAWVLKAAQLMKQNSVVV